MNTLEEFEKLKAKFPKVCTNQISCENVDWGDAIIGCKNGYYVFDSIEASECMYSYLDLKITSSIDTLWNGFCERVLETSDSVETSDSYFCQYLGQCYNMWFCFSCDSCHDCFGCYGLSNKSFCIFNIQYTEEEYQDKIKELKKIPPDETIKKVQEEVELKFPKLHSNYSDNNNSEYVDYVYKSNSAYYCFDCHEVDNSYYLTNCHGAVNSLDSSFCSKIENSIEIIDSSECYNCFKAYYSTRCYDSYYLDRCEDCNNCIACTNLSHKSYCVLNVQYTKEEYQQILANFKKELAGATA